jgi:hypothetical protein
VSDAVDEATPRFFQHGFACPGCRYDLSHAKANQCPECGMVLTEQMAIGRVRELSSAEADFGRAAIGRIGRGDLLVAVHAEVWRRYSVLVLVALAPALVYGLLRWSRVESDGFVDGFLVSGFLVGAAVSYGALLLVYGLLMAWTVVGFNRTAAGLRARRDHDVARGVAEEWWLEASHRLTLGTEGPMRTFLRMTHGGVCGVRRDAEAWLASGLGVRVRLAILPTSRVVVGLHSDGPAVRSVEHPSGKGIGPRRNSTVWCTPVVFFKSEAEALRGANPFVGSGPSPDARGGGT